MRGLVLPTGELIGAELLAQLKADGCEGIRITAFDCTGDEAWALAEEVLIAGMQPYLSVNRLDQILSLEIGSGVLVGFVNEPDLAELSPADYIPAFEDCIGAAQERKVKIFAAEISNLNERGFDYLIQLPWERWDPAIVGCAFHRYPDGRPIRPHRGFRSRHDEMETLRRIVGHTRQLLRTEVGYNNLTYTEDESAEHMVVERDFDVAEGVDWTFAYEGPDGPDPASNDVLDHYGFWRSSGFDNKKPVYYTFFG